MTGRTEVGRATFPLSQLAADGTADVWLPVESSMPGEHAGARGSCGRLHRACVRFRAAGSDAGPPRAILRAAGSLLPWCSRTLLPATHDVVAAGALTRLCSLPLCTAGERTQGAVRMSLSYKTFQDDAPDSGESGLC